MARASGATRPPENETPLDYEVDLRFMQGEYVGEDGKRSHGTFCLI